MNKLENLMNHIMESNLTILGARPGCGRPAIEAEFLYKYVIEKNKKTFLFSFSDDDTFYIEHLISRMTDISPFDIRHYFHPCYGTSKNNKRIDRDKFIDAIETIQRRKFYINANPFISNDYLDYILEFNDLESFDIIIIDDLDRLLQKSKYTVDEILTRLKESCKKHNTHIIFDNQLSRDIFKWKNRKIKLNDINHYKSTSKYIDNIIIINRTGEKGEFVEIKNYLDLNHIDEFKMQYDRNLDRVICEE